MLETAKQIYVATRKKHDLLFNVYVMRPIAAAVVGWVARTSLTPNQITLVSLSIFVGATATFAAAPTYQGGLLAIAILELSYCFDCVDGMLARFKGIASKEGHLFDFFTDEMKALLLVGFLAIRLFRGGGLGLDATMWPAGTTTFLLAGIAGLFVLASATSLTNFVRRPEISGRESQVEAHYETVKEEKPRTAAAKVMSLVTTFLRFLNHYPSHIWAWAIVDRLDLFFWVYVAINLLYLGRGWLGLLLRFGRPPKR
jgi:phosphatidylglycerophosphate synthase